MAGPAQTAPAVLRTCEQAETVPTAKPALISVLAALPQCGVRSSRTEGANVRGGIWSCRPERAEFPELSLAPWVPSQKRVGE